MSNRPSISSTSEPLSRAPLAAACALLLLSLPMQMAQAQMSSSGAVFVWPGNLPVPQGAGPADLGNSALFVGHDAPGSFAAQAGSQLRLGALMIAPSSAGLGEGSVLIDGAGTRVSLVGDGTSQGSLNRLGVGEWGRGSLTVSGGAVLDGRAEASACLGLNHFCNNFIGNAAGSTGVFTVTGAGSQASFLRAFVVGNLAVFRPPIDSFTFGSPGGSSRGTVNVLDGGLLVTDGASLGVGPGGSSPLGSERSMADVTVAGAGSRWLITGGTLENTAAGINAATHRNAIASIRVAEGGVLEIAGPSGQYNYLNLSSGGGRSDMSVEGPGSTLRFSGDASVLQVGRSQGSAALRVSKGGVIEGIWYTVVGRDASFGELVLEGAASRLYAHGMASVAATGNWDQHAVIDVGRNGHGRMTVRDGAQVEIIATQARGNGPHLNLGREAASSGSLSIEGPNSRVLLRAESVLAGGGAGEAYNPWVRIGRDGSGELNITGGGQLLLEGKAVSTVANSRGTHLYIGGTSDSSPGGRGIALVSGAGSAIKLDGSDAYIGIGHGPQSHGQLTISDQALVSSTNMIVGRSGGVGVLRVDGATLELKGQQTGSTLSGAALSVGRSGGIGVASLDHGAQLRISNPGSAGAGLYLGGTGPGPLGDGSLTLNNGSRLSIEAAPGKAELSVARDGSALMRVKGGSTVDVGDGQVFVGRLKGSDGTLLISENSALSAGWIGVGRNKTTQGDEDGGTGTLVLLNSTLTAPTIVVGSNGFLGGSGSIVGNVVNHGIFSPGNSPGTLRIEGDYRAGAGSRLLLEVQSDGQGGYLTDQLVFGAGRQVDLAGLKVEFRFLGGTDPTAFNSQAGRFDIGKFLLQSDGQGGAAALGVDSFSQVSFSASAQDYVITGFSYSPGSAAVFVSAPVPEPGTLALWLAGLGLAQILRRRSAAAA